LPALGFGMGDVVLGDLLQEKKLLPSLKGELDAFVLIEDEALRDISLAVVQQFRDASVSVEYSLTPAKADKQFKRAMELGSRVTVRCVLKDSTVYCIVKDLVSRKESEVPRQELLKEVGPIVGLDPKK
jgi:histidyl-tRNA synthetase